MGFLSYWSKGYFVRFDQYFINRMANWNFKAIFDNLLQVAYIIFLKKVLIV